MKYEVYENNGGAVMLAILDDDCKPAAIFENWEYGQRGDCGTRSAGKANMQRSTWL